MRSFILLFLFACFILEIAEFKIITWGGISSDIPSEMSFYNDLWQSRKTLFLDCKSDYSPPQMKILNMVIHILMHYQQFSFKKTVKM